MQVAIAEGGGRGSGAPEGGVSAWPPSWAESQGGQAEGPTVCRTEWSSGTDGLQRRAQLETTHWSAAAHSYGKVVAGMEVVSEAGEGRAVHARRQVEMVSARAPGMIRVMRASHSSSTSRSSNTHFEDMQVTLNRLDIGSNSAQWNNGAVNSGFESSLLASSFLHRGAITDPLAFYRNGQTQKLAADMKDVKNENDRSEKSTKTDSNPISTYKVNFPDNGSEDSFYDSCPEKESVFKDETQQLEEWRRASKIRRSLQFPRRTSANRGKVTDLPDNVGSVDRIKRELESINRPSSHSLVLHSSIRNDVQNVSPPIIEPAKIECIPENPEDNFGMDSSLENFTIKPSILKTKKFIAVERLNEVRERLKYLSGENKSRVEKNACEFVETIPESSLETLTPASGIRSYMFGMDGNNVDNEKMLYPRATNSLESRGSKTIGSSSARNDDWYTRRKSYGFEKVQNSLKNDHSSLSSRDRDNIESSTDSGIWRSTEIVNALSNSNSNSISQSAEYRSSRPVSSRAVTQGNGTTHNKETFEDWLIQNRKTFTENLYNCNKKDTTDEHEHEYGQLQMNDHRVNIKNSVQHTDLISVSDAIQRNELSLKNSLFKNNYKYHSERNSVSNNGGNSYSAQIISPGSELKPQSVTETVKDLHGPKMFADTKREISPNLDAHLRPEEDTAERKNKKVEFCKTEVHFAAESGRVNIVETDGKPPSTNNFRRRRRNANNAPKDIEKNGFPIMHFGDSTHETKTTEFQVYNVENSDDRLKLNFAVITEIKPTIKDSPTKPTVEDPPYLNELNCDDVSETDQPRGILKNKPVKPRPYHLGEDRQILPDSNISEKSLWGVKLRPVQDAAVAPLWKSSVTLKNHASEHAEKDGVDNKLKSAILSRLSTVNESNNKLDDKPLTYVINDLSETSSTEIKGYSTKVNFGLGDPIIETSFPHLNSKTGNTNESIEMKNEMQYANDKRPSDDSRSHRLGISNVQIKKSILEEKYKGTDQRSTVVNRTAISKENIAHIHNKTPHRGTYPHSDVNKKTNGTTESTFADSLSTPRASIPGRGSARKLKDHELSYFGVKGLTATASVVVEKSTVEKSMVEKKPEIFEDYKNHDPIYENVMLKSAKIKSKTKTKENVILKSVEVENKTKTKHPGETIIEELTKAADEILQALDGYSDGINTTDDDEKRNRNKYMPMATISETNSVKRTTKSSESKAVQTHQSSKTKHGNLWPGPKSRTRTSSNSSLESLTRETVSSSNKHKSHTSHTPRVADGERDKSHKKKISSSGEVVKARRLQRAHSRDALFHKHGSSSEDVAQAEVIRKKTKRVKHGGDSGRSVSKVLTYNDQNESIIDRSKESNRSIAAVTPDYNHKTAVSTIKSLHDRHSRRERDKNSEKVRSLGRERGHRSEKSGQSSLSSHSKQRVVPPEKSRSVDTSLERESGLSREKIHSREAVKKRTTSTQKHSSHSKSKSEELHSDAGKKVKSLSSTKTTAEPSEHRSGSSSKNAEGQLHSHSNSSNTKTERVKKS